MLLNDIAKRYKGIDYIFIEEAKTICKEYSKKNRKKNNQLEYMLSDDNRRLYTITRDNHHGKPLWCGDFIMNVVTEKQLKQSKEEA